MQDKHLFEYAVIRVVPQVEHEEFINVGVVLYCRPLKFLQTVFCIDEQRLGALSQTLDIGIVEKYLNAFKSICQGAEGSGPIGKLDVASRFRWLTATRSTIVQSSKIHPRVLYQPIRNITAIACTIGIIIFG